MIITMNGTLIEHAKAVVSVYDHGFLYGIGLFETFRTYGGRPYLLERHLDRLADGCNQLNIRHSLMESDISTQIAALLKANRLSDAYFRLTVTAGTDILGLPAGDYEHATVILYVKPLPPADETLYRTGKPLLLLRTRRNTPEGPYRLKSLHYMNNLLAKMELQQSAATSSESPYAYPPEGLMLTAANHLAEGIVSNVFFVRDRCLCTPSLETGILPGITRARVLELAAHFGIPVEEGLYSWHELLAADEVFITNSIQELVPVTMLVDEEGRLQTQTRISHPGPMTQHLLQQYRKEAIS